jgi:parallel beta-helix repeat protein
VTSEKPSSQRAGRARGASNNRAAPRQPKFAGTGIRAQGDCTDTVVEGNTFTNNNYGFAFIGARNIGVTGNTFTSNSVAGIHIEGDSRGGSQTKNVFGTSRADRNKANVVRVAGSKFGGAAVVGPLQPAATGGPKRK